MIFKKNGDGNKSKLGQETGRLKPVNPPAKQRRQGLNHPTTNNY